MDSEFNQLKGVFVRLGVEFRDGDCQTINYKNNLKMAKKYVEVDQTYFYFDESDNFVGLENDVTGEKFVPRINA